MKKLAIVLALALLCTSASTQVSQLPTGQGQLPTGSGGGGVAVATKAGTGFSSFTDPQGSCTLADSNAGIVLNCPGEGGSNVNRTVCKNAPATPYSAIGKIAFIPNVIPSGGSIDNWGGIGWRNSGASGMAPLISSGLVYWGGDGNTPQTQPGIFANNYTNYNTFAGSASMANGINLFNLETWFRLKDDGAGNVSFGFSALGDGVNFNSGFATTKTAGFLGATGYNLICILMNAKNIAMTLVLEQYKETSP
jgi:hypothetical protein